MSEARLLYGVDVIDGLKQLGNESVQCVVTSPPYWGLRNYGVAGQLGLEKTPQEFVSKMVEVFREVRRVLKTDGTIWVNMGDTYNNNPPGARNSLRWPKQSRNDHWSGKKKINTGLKQKDLCGIPWRLALALQDDGWYLRCDIIWSKPNPMPESVNDRPTKSHEYIFLLTKSSKYFYDADAISEEVSPNTHLRISQDLANQIGSSRANAGGKTNGNMKAVVRSPKALKAAGGVKNNESFASSVCLPVLKRNKRSVWEIGTQSFRGAHFATFPKEIPRLCIMAGCPEGGTVLDPFSGSGTTGEVATGCGRNYVGIELNIDYKPMAMQRIGLFVKEES